MLHLLLSQPGHETVHIIERPVLFSGVLRWRQRLRRRLGCLLRLETSGKALSAPELKLLHQTLLLWGILSTVRTPELLYHVFPFGEGHSFRLMHICSSLR